MSSIIKTNEYFDEEILKKANNRFYTPDEFTAVKDLNLASQLFCIHLNISSLFYDHLEQHDLVSNLKNKPNIIEISETRLQRGKHPITNNSLPNYADEYTPIESGKRGRLLYIDKNIK